MTTIEELKALEAKVAPGEWFALWRDSEGTGYPRNNATAFEFVGIPTSGNILTGCTSVVIAGVDVLKGTEQQSRAHVNIEFIAAARNALPALLAVAEAAKELRRAECCHLTDTASVMLDSVRMKLRHDLDAALAALETKEPKR